MCHISARSPVPYISTVSTRGGHSRLRVAVRGKGDYQVRARLALGFLATIAAACLVAWGLAPSAKPSPPSAQKRIIQRPSSGRSHASQPTIVQGWQLTFSPGFSGTAVNTALWATCYPWMDTTAGCTNFSNLQRGVEHEWYLPSQVRVRSHTLILIARQIPTTGQSPGGAPRQYSCRSGMVTTYPGYHFEYGYIQVVARIPLNVGLWPALWLAAASLHWPPEVDILEHWGNNPERTWLFFHPVGAPQQHHHLNITNLGTEWHTFSLNWTPTTLTWYVDGHMVYTTHKDIPHQSMYFIADLAESRPARPGWGCNGVLSIKSIRVWQHS